MSAVLEHAIQLMNNGDFVAALDAVIIVEEDTVPTSVGRLMSSVLHGRILLHLGRVPEALEHLIEVLRRSKGAAPQIAIVDAWRYQAACFCHLGKPDKAAKSINNAASLLKKLEDQGSHDNRKREAELEDLRGTTQLLKGNLDDALSCFKKSLEISKSIEYEEQAIRTLNRLGVAYYDKGDLDQALDWWFKGFVKSQSLGDKQQMATCLNNIGNAYRSKGDLDQAALFFEDSLKIAEAIKNDRQIGICLNNIGAVYEAKGELDVSFQYHSRALTTKELVNDRKGMAKSYYNLGRILSKKGKLEESMEFLLKSQKAYQDLGNVETFSMISKEIGNILRSKGDLEGAKKAYMERLDALDRVGNQLDAAHVLYPLVRVLAEMRDLGTAEAYLTQFAKINMKLNNPIVAQEYKLASAVIHKASDRLRNQVIAHEIFQEIAHAEILDHNLTIDALLYLAEALMLELWKTGNEDALFELNGVLDKLQKIAMEQESHSLHAETNLLQAQLMLLEGDTASAQLLLSQAQILAEERGLHLLARKISGHHDSMLGQIAQWQELSKNGSSVRERLDYMELETLVLSMLRKQVEEIATVEEEPVMLLIVANNSGLAQFSKSFISMDANMDQMTAGFLTSIDSFIGELFSTEGSIQRIKHDQYTMITKVSDQLRFWYIYKGQSYLAMRKLDTFINAVYTKTSLWNTLCYAGPALPTECRTALDELVLKIFDEAAHD